MTGYNLCTDQTLFWKVCCFFLNFQDFHWFYQFTHNIYKMSVEKMLKELVIDTPNWEEDLPVDWGKCILTSFLKISAKPCSRSGKFSLLYLKISVQTSPNPFLNMLQGICNCTSRHPAPFTEKKKSLKKFKKFTRSRSRSRSRSKGFLVLSLVGSSC